MAIIEGAEADAELDKVKAVEGLSAVPQSYPMLGLSADDFERLCYALFKVSAPDGIARDWEDAVIMLRGADAGRDLLLRAAEKPWGVVQCKRYESALSLPATLREVIKLILFPDADTTLPQVEEGAHYFLALASEPSKTVVDFFGSPVETLKAQSQNITAYVEEVMESYATLSGLDAARAEAKVRRMLPALEYKVIRPADLNGWIAREAGIAKRFFRHRILVDESSVIAGFSDMKSKFETFEKRLGDLPFVTDTDLKSIKNRMESVPETHRLSFGFASLFGFPKEMFEGTQNLKSRGERLNRLAMEVGQDYIDWLFEKANEMAGEICSLGEVVVQVRPFAQQIPAIFLGLVAKENLDRNVIGKIMSGILAKNAAGQTFTTDDDRLHYVKRILTESGARYLRGDFSAMTGEGELLATKKALARQLVAGLTTAEDLERVLAEGISVMRPHMDAAASELRRLSAYPLSIFMGDSSSIDDPDVVRRMADTARKLPS